MLQYIERPIVPSMLYYEKEFNLMNPPFAPVLRW